MKFNYPIPQGIIRPPYIRSDWWTPMSHKRKQYLSKVVYYESKIKGSRSKSKKRCLDIKKYIRIRSRPKYKPPFPSRWLKKYLKTLGIVQLPLVSITPKSKLGIRHRVEQNIPAAYIAPSYTDLRDSMSFLAQVAAKVAETQKTFYTLQCDKLRQVREEYIRQKVESERRIKENLRMCGLHPDPRVNFANGVTCTIVSTDNPPKGRSMDWFIEENNKE